MKTNKENKKINNNEKNSGKIKNDEKN